MSQQKQETEQEPSLLEVLLPSFMRKLDSNDCLDLMDRIPAGAYQGCGEYVMAINPDNGSIHEVCSGAEDGCYMGGLTDNCEKVFDAFAHRSAAEGYIPVTCTFSQWKACYIDLYFVDEAYQGHPLLEDEMAPDFKRFLEARKTQKAEQLEMSFVKSLQSVPVTTVSFQKALETLTAETEWTQEALLVLPRGKVIGLYTDHAGLTGTLDIV